MTSLKEKSRDFKWAIGRATSRPMRDPGRRCRSCPIVKNPSPSLRAVWEAGSPPHTGLHPVMAVDSVMARPLDKKLFRGQRVTSLNISKGDSSCGNPPRRPQAEARHCPKPQASGKQARYPYNLRAAVFQQQRRAIKPPAPYTKTARPAQHRARIFSWHASNADAG